MAVSTEEHRTVLMLPGGTAVQMTSLIQVRVHCSSFGRHTRHSIRGGRFRDRQWEEAICYNKGERYRYGVTAYMAWVAVLRRTNDTGDIPWPTHSRSTGN